MSNHTSPIRLFLALETLAFLTAASVHLGLSLHGYEHRQAGTAESVIGGVLLFGLALTAIRPASTRAVGLGAQAFALFGTLVGIFTIAVGIGPRTALDLTFHIGIVIVLIFGLIAAVRGPWSVQTKR